MRCMIDDWPSIVFGTRSGALSFLLGARFTYACGLNSFKEPSTCSRRCEQTDAFEVGLRPRCAFYGLSVFHGVHNNKIITGSLLQDTTALDLLYEPSS